MVAGTGLGLLNTSLNIIGGAGVTGSAEPDGRRAQRLLAKPFPDEGDDAARGEIHVDG